MQKIVVALLFLSQLAFSQNTITKNPGDFNKISSFDKIDIILIPSNENKVVLNGSGSNDVELVNKNGELKIRMPVTKMLKGDNVSATVYYKNIDAVEANEGSRIASEAVFKVINFDIIAKEGSEVKLFFEADRVSLKASSGSNIILSGNATNQDIVLNTGAILDASTLTTKQTIITVNTGGEAAIFATDFVDAKVRAGGNITIFGKPKQINKKTIAGGSIEEN